MLRHAFQALCMHSLSTVLLGTIDGVVHLPRHQLCWGIAAQLYRPKPLCLSLLRCLSNNHSHLSPVSLSVFLPLFFHSLHSFHFSLFSMSLCLSPFSLSGIWDCSGRVYLFAVGPLPIGPSAERVGGKKPLRACQPPPALLSIRRSEAGTDTETMSLSLSH